ncbi:MAG: hypothetical protein AAB667_00715 [Patescibacteria group bacterium]
MGNDIKINLRQKRAGLFGPLAILNAGLMATALVLILYFVFSSNAIAAQRYSIRHLSEKSASLSAENGVLMAERARFEDSALLSDFARAENMVEARDVAYIFENGSVAVTDRNAP